MYVPLIYWYFPAGYLSSFSLKPEPGDWTALQPCPLSLFSPIMQYIYSNCSTIAAELLCKLLQQEDLLCCILVVHAVLKTQLPKCSTTSLSPFLVSLCQLYSNCDLMTFPGLQLNKVTFSHIYTYAFYFILWHNWLLNVLNTLWLLIKFQIFLTVMLELITSHITTWLMLSQ